MFFSFSFTLHSERSYSSLSTSFFANDTYNCNDSKNNDINDNITIDNNNINDNNKNSKNSIILIRMMKFMKNCNFDLKFN